MAEGESRSIIHKKARVGREDFDARAMSPSKALRLSLAKFADTLFDLPLSVSMVEQSAIAAASIQEKLEGDGLLILLDGAAGLRGAAKLDTQFTAALIEAQIIGSVRETEARPRSYTRTDAAMVAPFLDHVLQGFDAQLAEHSIDHRPFAMRFGDRMEDTRVLALALEGGWFDVLNITAELAEGAKTGVITFLLPQRAPARKEAGSEGQNPATAGGLAKNALEAAATLDAVIARLDLPIKDICALKPGATLVLPPDSLSETQLYAPARHLVAEVRLGQLNGQRAVRFVSNNLSQETDDANGAGQDTPYEVRVPQAEVLPAMPDLDIGNLELEDEFELNETIDSTASDVTVGLENSMQIAET